MFSVCGSLTRSHRWGEGRCSEASMCGGLRCRWILLAFDRCLCTMGSGFWLRRVCRGSICESRSELRCNRGTGLGRSGQDFCQVWSMTYRVRQGCVRDSNDQLLLGRGWGKYHGEGKTGF